MKCTGIDLFENTDRFKYDDPAFKVYKHDKLTPQRTEENILKNKGNEDSEVRLIKGNSFESSTFNSLTGSKFDLIFLDGDHSFDGIKNDFSKTNELLNKKGLMVLDDYSNSWPEVIDFADNNIDYAHWKKIGVFFDNELVLRKI